MSGDILGAMIDVDDACFTIADLIAESKQRGLYWSVSSTGVSFRNRFVCQAWVPNTKSPKRPIVIRTGNSIEEVVNAVVRGVREKDMSQCLPKN